MNNELKDLYNNLYEYIIAYIKRLKRLGFVIRIDDRWLINQDLDGKPRGRREDGRPKTRLYGENRK